MDMPRAAELIGMLSNENRFAIIRQLAEAGDEGVSVADLAKALDMTTRNVRNQMRRLINTGLASEQKRERVVYYRANGKELRAFVGLLSAVLSPGYLLPSPEASARQEETRVKERTGPRAKKKNTKPRETLKYRSLRERLSAVEELVD